MMLHIKKLWAFFSTNMLSDFAFPQKLYYVLSKYDGEYKRGYRRHRSAKGNIFEDIKERNGIFELIKEVIEHLRIDNGFKPLNDFSNRRGRPVCLSINRPMCLPIIIIDFIAQIIYTNTLVIIWVNT